MGKANWDIVAATAMFVSGCLLLGRGYGLHSGLMMVIGVVLMVAGAGLGWEASRQWRHPPRTAPGLAAAPAAFWLAQKLPQGPIVRA
jgi:hypothetical protein